MAKTKSCLLLAFLASLSMLVASEDIKKEDVMSIYTRESESDEQLTDEDDQEYESLNLVFYKQFFDDFGTNLLEPLFDKLSGFDFPDYVSVPLEILENSDLISIEANITSPLLADIGMAYQTAIIALENDKAKLQLDDLQLVLQADYAYVSDPPLFADIGEATI